MIGPRLYGTVGVLGPRRDWPLHTDPVGGKVRKPKNLFSPFAFRRSVSYAWNVGKRGQGNRGEPTTGMGG